MEISLFVQIGLGILFLASAAIAYLSAKTWHVGQVLVVLAIFLFAGFYLYLSAKVLKIHQHYGEQVTERQATLERVRSENQVLEAGDAQNLGIRQVRHELLKITRDRGRVWRNCQPQGMAQDGSVTVATAGPHTLPPGTTLFVFEQGTVTEGARYLGEFVTAAGDAATVTIRPAMAMTDEELKRIAETQAMWSLYEVMPSDRHDVFAEYNEEQLAASVPAPSVAEYQRDGGPAQDDDPPERIVGYDASGVIVAEDAQERIVERRFVRQLRDYAWLFRDLDRQRAIDRTSIARAQRDAAGLEAATASAQSDIEQRTAEKGKLQEDQEKFRMEIAAISKHLQAVEGLLERGKQMLSETINGNRQLASQLAEWHLKWTREIDSRTSALPARASSTRASSTRPAPELTRARP